MTDSMPSIPDDSVAEAPSAVEVSDAPWLAVLLGVALLLSLFILLALIAG